ncbi:hypothetical protein QCA50_000602 [Cerrena zonata]|uniref:Uncharacterized protein n=1 Tax=Cerrena zonata TaxID=2478898 RepID=A0AAW0GRE3_9APHY
MSSLLNALNPNAVQSRTRTRTNTQNTQVNYTPQPIHAVAQPPPGPAQSYVPHRSELEGAIVEPPAGSCSCCSSVGIIRESDSKCVAHSHLRPPQPTPVAPPSAVPDQFAQILQFLTEGREAAAREQERRIQWEREQEARFSQREAEIRETFSSMQERITELAELVTSRPATSTSGVSTPASFYRPTFPTLEQAYIPPDTPFSPMAQSPYAPSPTFVQGSSRQPILVHPIAMSMPVTPITAYSPVPIMTHATSTPPTHTPHTPHVPPPIPPHSHPQPILDLSTSPTASSLQPQRITQLLLVQLLELSPNLGNVRLLPKAMKTTPVRDPSPRETIDRRSDRTDMIIVA